MIYLILACYAVLLLAVSVAGDLRRQWRVSFFLAWFDFWIGLFYDQKKHTLYICPLPCCVFKVEMAGDWRR